jgi:hypothetical protein
MQGLFKIQRWIILETIKQQCIKDDITRPVEPRYGEKQTQLKHNLFLFYF